MGHGRYCGFLGMVTFLNSNSSKRSRAPESLLGSSNLRFVLGGIKAVRRYPTKRARLYEFLSFCLALQGPGHQRPWHCHFEGHIASCLAGATGAGAR